MPMTRQSICWTFMKQLFKIKNISIHNVRHKGAEIFHQWQQEVGDLLLFQLRDRRQIVKSTPRTCFHIFIAVVLALSGSEFCNGIVALEALWFMYSTQRLWECSGPLITGSLLSFSTPLSDVICQGLMNCWLCFSGGASLMYYRWTAGPGLLSVCIAYVESSLKSL